MTSTLDVAGEEPLTCGGGHRANTLVAENRAIDVVRGRVDRDRTAEAPERSGNIRIITIMA
jgi:hypothetical protein